MKERHLRSGVMITINPVFPIFTPKNEYDKTKWDLQGAGSVHTHQDLTGLPHAVQPHHEVSLVGGVEVDV